MNRRSLLQSLVALPVVSLLLPRKASGGFTYRTGTSFTYSSVLFEVPVAGDTYSALRSSSDFNRLLLKAMEGHRPDMDGEKEVKIVLLDDNNEQWAPHSGEPQVTVWVKDWFKQEGDQLTFTTHLTASAWVIRRRMMSWRRANGVHHRAFPPKPLRRMLVEFPIEPVTFG